MKARLFIYLQYLLPKRWLSLLMGKLAVITYPPFKDWFIGWFIRRYQVDMSLALESDPRKYQHFNHFFTRVLRPGVRSIVSDPKQMACPVDGTISQIGRLKQERILQAKGKTYTLNTLLAGNDDLTKTFHNGHFATIYLAPKDYHRIHLPLSGRLVEMTYVPGQLFSVNPTTAANVDDLFARNERVIAIFDTAIGKMAVILVGAMIVGSMRTTWHGQVTPPHGKTITTWTYDDQHIAYSKGDEIGYFQMGSTVIVLFEQDCIDWQASLQADSAVILGQAMAKLLVKTKSGGKNEP